jgi:hypothetical protein
MFASKPFDVLYEYFLCLGDKSELYEDDIDHINRARNAEKTYMQVCAFSIITNSMLGIVYHQINIYVDFFF